MDTDPLYYELVAFVEGHSGDLLTKKELKAFKLVINFIKDYN